MVGTRAAMRMLEFYEGRQAVAAPVGYRVLERENDTQPEDGAPPVLGPLLQVENINVQNGIGTRVTTFSVASHPLTNQTGNSRWEETHVNGRTNATISYTPDAAATALGLPAETWSFEARANMQFGTFEYAVTGNLGAESQSALNDTALSWNSASADFVLRDMPDIVDPPNSAPRKWVQLSGDIRAENGTHFAVNGGRVGDAFGEFRVMSYRIGESGFEEPEFVIVFPNVTDLREASGYVFDKDPEAGEAKLYGRIFNKPGFPVFAYFIVDPPTVPFDFLTNPEAQAAQDAAAQQLAASAARLEVAPGVTATGFRMAGEAPRQNGEIRYAGSATLDRQAVRFRTWDRPFMGEAPDVIEVASGKGTPARRLEVDQEDTSMVIVAGSHTLRIDRQPDASFLVDGQPAPDAAAAARLARRSPVVAQAPAGTFGGMVLALASLPEAGSRAPSPCNSKAGENKSAVKAGQDRLSYRVLGRPTARVLHELAKPTR